MRKSFNHSAEHIILVSKNLQILLDITYYLHIIFLYIIICYSYVKTAIFKKVSKQSKPRQEETIKYLIFFSSQSCKYIEFGSYGNNPISR